MNRVVPLVRTGEVVLRRFDHVPDVAHRDPERERTTGHAVAFVETGSFRLRTSGAWREVTTDWLFVTSPSLEFSCAHDEEHPRDCCLSVAYSDEAVESARSAVALSLHPCARCRTVTRSCGRRFSGARQETRRASRRSLVRYWGHWRPPLRERRSIGPIAWRGMPAASNEPNT